MKTPMYEVNEGYELDVTKAEALFSKFLVEHNIPIAASDHAGDLFREMFPDSKIASKFGSARTKTSAILECFSDLISEELTEVMRTQPFSLATDGSNDNNKDQLYPLVVRYYNKVNGKVVTELLTLRECTEASTRENIFNLLDTEFTKRQIPWTNCVAFRCDNASVMLGVHKGVAAFIKQRNPSVFIQGCPCHLLHIAAKNGCKELHIDVEQVLVDICFYFDKSSKRRHTFQQFQQDTSCELKQILKHGSTRWLSLFSCIARLLQQWEALDAYFRAETGKTARLQRVQAFFGDPLSKAYCLFLNYILPLFTEANLYLQREEPVLHTMQAKMQEVLTSLIVKFIKPRVVTGCSSIYKIDYGNKENQKRRGDVVIGKEARDYISANLNVTITESQETLFFSDVKKFFASSCDYIVANLPLEDELLAHAEVLDVKKRSSQSITSLQHFLDNQPALSGT